MMGEIKGDARSKGTREDEEKVSEDEEKVSGSAGIKPDEEKVSDTDYPLDGLEEVFGGHDRPPSSAARSRPGVGSSGSGAIRATHTKCVAAASAGGRHVSRKK